MDHSAVFEDIEGIRKIRVTNDETIKCFVSFVHGFIHYVSSQGDIPPFSLLEFPSIYYERLSANYLVKFGYDENIIKQVIRDRNQNNLDIYSSLAGILMDICKYNKKGPITQKDKIEQWKKFKRSIYKTQKNLIRIFKKAGEPLEKLELLAMQNYTYEELVNKECDENIARFIKKGILVLDGYQYLTDSYLVSSILKQSDSDNMLDKMIFVTEHLGEFNVEKIIHYFGIDNTFAPKSKILKS